MKVVSRLCRAEDNLQILNGLAEDLSMIQLSPFWGTQNCTSLMWVNCLQIGQILINWSKLLKIMKWRLPILSTLMKVKCIKT